MAIGITATLDTAAVRQTAGSTRAYVSGPKSTDGSSDPSNHNVVLSSRMLRLAENYGSSRGQIEAGSSQQGAPEHIGASDRRHISAGENGQVDYGSNVDTVGGPFETMDRVLVALRHMGQDAVLAQANQLPTGAMS